MSNPIKHLLRKAYFSKRFNKVAVRLYSTVHPPPYLRDRMEFDLDVWNGICTFRSSQGRQIGENNTNPEIYTEVVETEHKICKFEGSRYGLPINVTALREVMAVWDDALQFTTLARNDYIQRRGLPSSRLNLRQAYLFSKLGAAIPAYLARRREHPLKNGQLPPLETAFFTLGVGPFMVVRALMEKGDLTPLSEEPLSAEAMYQLADTSGSIVSAAGKGCAGSKKLFLDLLDVAMNGSYAKPLNSTEAQRAIHSLGDLAVFYRYVYASSRLELLIKLNQYLCAEALFALQAQGGLSDAEQRLAQTSLDRCYHKAQVDLTAQQVITNFIRVALVLLDDMDLPAARGALQQAGLIDADGVLAAVAAVSAAAPSSASCRAAAAQRIRHSSALLHPLCVAAMAEIDQALGRTTPGPAVTLAEFLSRCGRPSLSALLSALEAPLA